MPAGPASIRSSVAVQYLRLHIGVAFVVFLYSLYTALTSGRFVEGTFLELSLRMIPSNGTILELIFVSRLQIVFILGCPWFQRSVQSIP
jgi:hypothetical protein